MRIDLKPYGLVYSGDTDIYDVDFLIIDEEEKTIECNSSSGFAIANIHYDECDEVGYLEYGDDERLTGNDITIAKDGKLVIGGADSAGRQQ